MAVRVETSVEMTPLTDHRRNAHHAMHPASAAQASTKEGCHGDFAGLEG
jgi:hypothetical protein